jgi:hypothetical protein
VRSAEGPASRRALTGSRRGQARTYQAACPRTQTRAAPRPARPRSGAAARR